MFSSVLQGVVTLSLLRQQWSLTLILLFLCRDENWEFFLKLHVEWRCEYLSDKWNPFVKEKQYKDLTMRERILILHKLCHWRLELDDIADLLRVSVALIMYTHTHTLAHMQYTHTLAHMQYAHTHSYTHT